VPTKVAVDAKAGAVKTRYNGYIQPGQTLTTFVPSSGGSSSGGGNGYIPPINSDPIVTSISVRAQPTKSVYSIGEALDLTGLIITLVKSDSTMEDVRFEDFSAMGISTSPANGTILTINPTLVTVAYTINHASTIIEITVNSPSIIPTGEIDPGDIENMIAADLIEVIQGEDGSYRVVDGTFTSAIVSSESDAVSVLNNASTLFGNNFLADVSDISVQSVDGGLESGESFYRFSPSVNGVPVLGSQIILSANGDGIAQGLFSTYDDRINNVDTEPSLYFDTASEVQETVEEALRSEVLSAGEVSAELLDAFMDSLLFESSLVVYASDEKVVPFLAWRVLVNSIPDENQDDTLAYSELDGGNLVFPDVSLVYFIYANGGNAGSVFTWQNNLMSSWADTTATEEDLLGNSRSISVQTENGAYRLVDSNRDMITYQTMYRSEGFLGWSSRPVFPGRIITKPAWDLFNTWKKGVSAHANMAVVYDYYKNVLSHESFDKQGATVKISTEGVGPTEDSLDPFSFLYSVFVNDNAYWLPGDQQFLFNNTGGNEGSLDIVGHEFTHAVIAYIVEDGHAGYGNGLRYWGETGALNESYADIMGALIENKTDSGRWSHGEDTPGGASRDLSQPSAHNQPEHYSALSDPTWSNYLNQFKNRDYEGVHIYSSIFNFAAYKMMVDSRTSSISNQMWARVFYNSLYRLTSNATFLDARGAVIASAKAQGFDSMQQQAIKDAFDAVGIVESDSIRIILRWGASPRDLDSHMTGPTADGSDRFHTSFWERTYSYESLPAADLDWDYTDHSSASDFNLKPEITTIRRLTPGEYRFHVHDYSNLSSTSSTALAHSGATVSIYRGTSNTPLKTFTVDPASDGTLWSVFKLDISSSGGVTITDIDAYSYVTDPEGIGTRTMPLSLDESKDSEIQILLRDLPPKK
jgi:Zn-dependent metalloprotease